MRLIVGIDPGATVGIAIVDAGSRTKRVETLSKRNFSYSEILEWLSGKGEPIIVATDKARAPLLARKVAAAFGAKLYAPRDDMRKMEKKAIAKEHNTGNDHEEDALAAALYAKSQFMDIIEKVERSVELGKQGIVKKLLVTGQAPNIEIALEMLETRKQQRVGKERVKERDRLFAKLSKELEDARRRNRHLEGELAQANNRLADRKYERDESAALDQLRRSSIKVLLEKDKIIRNLEKIIEGQYILVEYFGASSDLAGKAVILDDGNDGDVRKIESSGAAAIITDKEVVSSLPVIRKGKANIRSAGKFLIIDKIQEQDDFETWLDAYKLREREKEIKEKG